MIASSPAQIRYSQDGLIAVLPKTSKNLDLLLANMEKTGNFDLEFCYSLRQRESLEGLAGEIKNSIMSGTGVEANDAVNLPIFPRMIPNFREFCLLKRA